jgi:uncharacterized membrane protein (UPF0127 family)
MHGHTLLARAIMVVMLFIIAACAIAALLVYALGKTAPLQDTTGLTRVAVAGTSVFMRVADTEAEREQGLSGTEPLKSNEGMLFEFDREGYYSIWMKDMRYPIDVVWVSEQGIIVHIEKSLSPASYPAAYTSTLPARTILELPTGFADAHHVILGARVTIY